MVTEAQREWWAYRSKELEAEKTAKLSPLFRAAKNNNPKEIKRLVAKGANVDEIDADGKTALIIAVESGNYLAVQALLEAKGDIFIKDIKGKTALIHAKNNKMFNFLLNNLLKESFYVGLLAKNPYRTEENFFSRLPNEILKEILLYTNKSLNELITPESIVEKASNKLQSFIEFPTKDRLIQSDTDLRKLEDAKKAETQAKKQEIRETLSIASIIGLAVNFGKFAHNKLPANIFSKLSDLALPILKECKKFSPLTGKAQDSAKIFAKSGAPLIMVTALATGIYTLVKDLRNKKSVKESMADAICESGIVVAEGGAAIFCASVAEAGIAMVGGAVAASTILPAFITAAAAVTGACAVGMGANYFKRSVIGKYTKLVSERCAQPNIITK
ncbi:MAG: ankyrin repeat domain-containing protein [Alphaproteobacteria bacterium]